MVWEAVSVLGIVPSYMLPSPVAVCQAFINEMCIRDRYMMMDIRPI